MFWNMFGTWDLNTIINVLFPYELDFSVFLKGTVFLTVYFKQILNIGS